MAVALNGEDVSGWQFCGQVGGVLESLELDFANEPEVSAALLRLAGEEFEESVVHDGEIERVQGAGAEERLRAADGVDSETDMLRLRKDAALKIDFRCKLGRVGGDFRFYREVVVAG